MKSKSLLVMIALTLAAPLHAQQNNNQYFQEQQRIQQQHSAEQARQGHMRSQEHAPPQPAGEWKTTWGAIGGNAQKGILGAATDQPTEQATIQAALADCQQRVEDRPASSIFRTTTNARSS